MQPGTQLNEPEKHNNKQPVNLSNTLTNVHVMFKSSSCFRANKWSRSLVFTDYRRLALTEGKTVSYSASITVRSRPLSLYNSGRGE